VCCVWRFPFGGITKKWRKWERVAETFGERKSFIYVDSREIKLISCVGVNYGN